MTIKFLIIAGLVLATESSAFALSTDFNCPFYTCPDGTCATSAAGCDDGGGDSGGGGTANTPISCSGTGTPTTLVCSDDIDWTLVSSCEWRCASGVFEYRCAPGYYGPALVIRSGSGTKASWYVDCNKCPADSAGGTPTSDAGTFDVTGCYVSVDSREFSDDIGGGVYSGKCYYVN